MSEREPSVTTNQADLEFAQYAADKRVEEKRALQDSIFGESATGGTEAHEKRRSEGLEYYRRLEELSKRGEVKWQDIYDKQLMESAYTEATAEDTSRSVEKAHPEALEDNRVRDIKLQIASDARFKRLSLLAEQTSQLRGRIMGGDSSARLDGQLKDRELGFEELRNWYNNVDHMNPDVLQYISELAASTPFLESGVIDQPKNATDLIENGRPSTEHPALDGESQEEYEARNGVKIPTLEGLTLNPVISVEAASATKGTENASTVEPNSLQSTLEATAKPSEAIQARIDYHVGLTELQEKATALAELRAKGQQDNAVFKEMMSSFNTDFSKAQKWLTINHEDDGVFEYIKSIATGVVSVETTPESKPVSSGAKIPTLENLFVGAVPAETAESFLTTSEDKVMEADASKEMKAEKVSIWKRLSERAARLRKKASGTFGKSTPVDDRIVPFQDKVSISNETPRVFEARVDHVFKMKLMGYVAILTLSKSN